MPDNITRNTPSAAESNKDHHNETVAGAAAQRVKGLFKRGGAFVMLALSLTGAQAQAYQTSQQPTPPPPILRDGGNDFSTRPPGPPPSAPYTPGQAPPVPFRRPQGQRPYSVTPHGQPGSVRSTSPHARNQVRSGYFRDAYGRLFYIKGASLYTFRSGQWVRIR